MVMINGKYGSLVRFSIFVAALIFFVMAVSFITLYQSSDNSYVYAADEKGLEVNMPYYFPYYKLIKEAGGGVEWNVIWSHANFQPFSDVNYVETSSIGEAITVEMNVYNWTFTNKEDASIIYSGSYNYGSINWTNNNYPKIAGYYNVTVTAEYKSVTYTFQSEITLRGYIRYQKVDENISPYVIYDGNDYIDFFGVPNNPSQDSHAFINSFYILDTTESKGMRQDIQYYTYLMFEDYVTEVMVVDSYPFELGVGKIAGGSYIPLDYFDYGYVPEGEASSDSYFTNKGIFSIKKRPLRLSRFELDQNNNPIGAVIARKSKQYDGTIYAFGEIYVDGSDSSAYDYLLDVTKIWLDGELVENSGFLQNDFNSIKDRLQSTPLLIFSGINAGGQILDSYYFTYDQYGNEIPTNSISLYDEDGNIIYDKNIRLYYAFNRAHPVLDNYCIYTDGEINHNALYGEFVEEECAILPGQAQINIDPKYEQYGFMLSSLQYQLLQPQQNPATGYTGVYYSGNLMGKEIVLINDPSQANPSNISIIVKIGRLYIEGMDGVNDIAFRGLNSDNEELLLVEYTYNQPPIGNYYFYIEVYYDGARVPKPAPQSPFLCDNIIVLYTARALVIEPKQLVYPEGLVIQTVKEYDGRVETGFSDYSFDDQWVGDDGLYVQARIKPVFDSSYAGVNRTITVSFVLQLTEAGEALGQPNLINEMRVRYLMPPEVTMSGEITRKEIPFSFDMSNAVDRPIYHPILFPDQKILIYEKPFGEELPTITDLIFGDYVYDDEGEIVYEDAYVYEPVVYYVEGIPFYELDFYGNIVYEKRIIQPVVKVPKRQNYFIYNDDPFSTDTDNIPAGFSWDMNNIIDWSFHCIAHYENGELKSIEVSRYDPVTGQVTIVDGPPNAVLNADTPPTGYPGVPIKLKEFYSYNYKFTPKLVDNKAFLQVTKKTPEWSVNIDQSAVYNGKRHSNMLEDLENYDEFYEFIKVNLLSHEEAYEIIGYGGKGINIEIVNYAPIGEVLRPISEYDYEEQIRLIKHAGVYETDVWLPETTTFNASEKVRVFLTINKMTLTVVLSNSQKNYGDPNPDDSVILYKHDTKDPTTWGWRINEDETQYREYLSTIIYLGFVNGEAPDKIGSLGTFEHCSIDYEYDNVNELSPPGVYYIWPKGGKAHNYSFVYLGAELHINKTKAEIIIINDEVYSTYTPDVMAQTVNEYVDGEYDPLAAYIYTADDTSKVDIVVVGYAPLDSSYDFSLHFKTVVDEEGNTVDIFYPKIVFHNGEWVPYEESLSGDIRDCSPSSSYIVAKNVGQYILKLSANAINYLNPTEKYVKFIIEPAQTEVTVTEGVIEHAYNGDHFQINGLPSDDSDDNFITNNEEADVWVTVEISNETFSEFQIIFSNRKFTKDMNTEIINAGYYRITLRFAYEDGRIINYILPENNEFYLYVQVVKGKVILNFEGEEGSENWLYRGLPYEVLDIDNMQPGDLGVVYTVVPHVPFEDIIVEIYRYQLDENGNPIEKYYDENNEEIIFKNPYTQEIIPLPYDLKVDFAIDAGIYLFRIKASGENTLNYDDSEWIQRKYTIKKAPVEVSIRGALIRPEDLHLYPGLTRYPLEKTYGDEIIKENYEVYYTGWVNGEDPFGENPPAGFEPAIILWNELNDRYLNARPATPYSIIPAQGGCDNYTFVYRSSSFYVYKKQGEIWVNEEYTSQVYTGSDHRYISTFRADRAPEEGEEALPFAFSLNHDPMHFTITLKAKLVYNPQTGQFERDTSVTECVDAGIYIFAIWATEGLNFTAVGSQENPLEYQYTITKAELVATLSNEEITYGDYYPYFELKYTGFAGRDIPDEAPVYRINAEGICELISGENTVSDIVHPTLVIPSNAIDCGNYEIGLEGGGSKNYTINTDYRASLKINKKPITVGPNNNNIVEKEYDNSDLATDWIFPRHYAFYGVIKHYLKDTEDVVILKSFAAYFAEKTVGSHAVKVIELMIDNSNYELKTIEFTCEGKITPRAPEITIQPATYTYDGTPKEIIPKVEGLQGDTVEYEVKYKGSGNTVYTESVNPPKTAGTYIVTVTTTDPNYVSKKVEATMVINKERVKIEFGGDTQQVYGRVSGLSAWARGVENYRASVYVRYYDENGNEVADITKADAGSYTARAYYETTINYLSNQGEEMLHIKPTEVTVTFQYTGSYIYDGAMKHSQAYFYNVEGQSQYALIKYALVTEENDEIYINVNEDGDVIPSIAPKDCGKYIAYAVAPNKNYTLIGDTLSASFEIKPRDLIIKCDDIVVNKGETPYFTFTLQGIASNESINSLDTAPQISYFDNNQNAFAPGVPSEVGVYRILPYAAFDRNYNISYAEGKLSINSVQLVANTSYSEGLILLGSFNPDASLSVKVVYSGNYSKAGNSFEVYKMENQKYKNAALSDIYEITLNNSSLSPGETITVKLLLPSHLRGAESYEIAHIKPNGEVEVFEVSQIDGNYISFEVNELGYFSVLVEGKKSMDSIWVYLAIAGAVVVILIGIAVIKKKA